MNGRTLVLSGADLVLPDRVVGGDSLILQDGHIVEVLDHPIAPHADRHVLNLSGRLVLPGFVDVHVHGLEGFDTLDAPSVIATLAARMPRYGVTAFCPTTVACPPAALRSVVQAVREARVAPRPHSARVLPAHLESNFVNPDYKGAQPPGCIRVPGDGTRAIRRTAGDDFTGDDILAVIDQAGPDVAIVTMAPEIEGGLELVQTFARAGRIVSLGHSGATFDMGLAAIEAGARHATHLFNRMPPVGHREPGLAAAMLQSADIAAELVGDGYHVHPGMMRVAIAAKGPDRIMAITDGSAGAGLPPGSRATLGGRPITVTEHASFLDDHTLAGSTATMDRVFRVLVSLAGSGLVHAAQMCSTTPARELGLFGHGVIAAGAVADLVVLSQQLTVVETFVNGQPCLGRLRVT